jgi:hypothetical protein
MAESTSTFERAVAIAGYLWVQSLPPRADQFHTAAGEQGLDPVAVEFQLVQPVVAFGRRIAQACQLGLHKSWELRVVRLAQHAGLALRGGGFDLPRSRVRW